ncbi:MAG: hypothetical protein ACLP7Q_03885 [Isosphaeraceae bacterium]
MGGVDDQMSEVLQRVIAWSPADRITLARRILETLEPKTLTAAPVGRGRSFEEIREQFQTDSPVPDDATVRRWISEERLEKYGR